MGYDVTTGVYARPGSCMLYILFNNPLLRLPDPKDRCYRFLDTWSVIVFLMESRL